MNTFSNSPHNGQNASRKRKHPSDDGHVSLPAASDPAVFLAVMADSLRLQQESLSLAFIFTARYQRYLRDNPELGDMLDDHTLALAALSLATKATESPRRLREFLLPAYAIIQPNAPPLTFPSTLYDDLRSTLVTAELLLLRILKFDLRIPLPYDYLPRFLEKTLTFDGTAHFDDLPNDEREESAVVDVKETSLGRAVWNLVGDAVKNYRMANLFDARTVAVACFWKAQERSGLRVAQEDSEGWLRRLTDRVEWEDFRDAVDVLEEEVLSTR